MKCALCEEKAVITAPARCKQHFIAGFEERVFETIERFDLIRDGERICVAASGGKDSLALLHVLKRRYDVEALSVDEGIAGYRDQTLQDLEEYCVEHDVPLRLVSFEDLGAERLDAREHSHPCSTCGVLRRKALMEYSADYDLLATGHNLDDECQNVLMNLLRNQGHLLARLGPRTAPEAGVAARIKPFYLTPEREVRAYCVVMGITANFSECPNIVKSFRWDVGEALNRLERERPGSKRRMIETFLSKRYVDDKETGTCGRCGGPASGDVCRACKLIVVS